MVKITCSSCGKQLQIDETKLPMKEVKFPCPHCKTNQFYDRSKVAGDAAADVLAVAPALVDDDDDDYGKPKAILVGREVPAIRDAVRTLGLVPLHFATAEEARDAYFKEHPRIVVLCPQQMTPPPLAEIGALTSVSPTDRRRGFYVLVADNMKTLDGNAAFLYGVNLVIATKDVGSFKKIYRDANDFHEKLYEHFNSLREAK